MIKYALEARFSPSRIPRYKSGKIMKALQWLTDLPVPFGVPTTEVCGYEFC